MTPWLQAVVQQGAETLPHVPEAVAYLARRGVSLAQAADHQLGWLPEETPCPEGAGPEFTRWQQRYLRQRLIFPITDGRGRITGLQTRRLDEKVYRTYYAVSRDVYPPAFGVGQSMAKIFTTGHCVLVEGPFDYLAVRAAGATTALAQLTSRPSEGLLTLLRRYVTHVVALLDMDEPGRHGVARLTRALEPHGITVAAPSYPAHDPSEFWGTPLGQRLLPHWVQVDDLARILRFG